MAKTIFTAENFSWMPFVSRSTSQRKPSKVWKFDTLSFRIVLAPIYKISKHFALKVLEPSPVSKSLYIPDQLMTPLIVITIGVQVSSCPSFSQLRSEHYNDNDD